MAAPSIRRTFPAWNIPNTACYNQAVISLAKGILLSVKHHTLLFVSTAVLLFAACSAAELATMGMRPVYAKSPTLDTRPQWRTVVLPPSSASPATLSGTTGLQDFAGMSLLQTGKFTLIDRSAVDQLLDEQEFSYSGVVDQATAVQLGRLLGAEAVMTISILSITHDSFWTDDPDQRDADIHVKIISVETSEVLYTSAGQGSDFSGADGALRSALQVALMGLTN